MLLVIPAVAAADTGGTVAGLRVAATRLLDAELARDGATACGILNAPLTATVNGRSCAQRWDARFAHVLGKRGGKAHVLADLRAVASAAVAMNGNYASIALPQPLLAGHSQFYWTNNCWMLVN